MRAPIGPWHVASGADLDLDEPLLRVAGRGSIWCIRLRWFVPPALSAAAAVGHLLGLQSCTRCLLAVAVAILAYNCLFWLLRRKVVHAESAYATYFVWAQVSLDYLAIFALIELLGGISSPLSVFLLFHILLAAMLLPPRSAWVASAAAVAGLGAIAAYDQHTGVTHALRYGGASVCAVTEPRLIAVELLTFAAAAFVTAFLGTTVLHSLRLLMLDLFHSRAAVVRVSTERDRFMLQVTHNLRAPIAACVSFADVLAGDYLGPLNEKQRGYVGRLDRRLHGLLDMIGEVLGVLRHRDAVRTMQRSPVDIAGLAARVHQVFCERAQQQGIELLLQMPGDERLMVLGDETLLEQVVENLVSNALKYTPSGRVTIRVGRAPDVLRVRVEVEDTGIGVPAADMPRLFSEFFRARNARALDDGGVGLGLAMVKHTIEQHGGQVAVQSREGEGSTFRFELPLHAEAE